MNDEIHKAFSDLHHEMMLAYRKYANISSVDAMVHTAQRYNHFGGVLDEVRLGIEVSGYHLRHYENLCIIYRFLEEMDDSKLQAELRHVANLLGDPPKDTTWVIADEGLRAANIR